MRIERKREIPDFFIPFKIALNLAPLDPKIGQLFKLPTPFGRNPENEGYWIEISKKENRRRILILAPLIG